MPAKTYQIGNKTYIQRPIVMGQLGLLLPLLESVRITESGLQPGAVLAALGRNLPRALAVVLIEDDLSVREAMNDLDARTDEMQWAVSPETALEVIEDFFDCNPISSIARRIREVSERIKQRADAQASSTGLSLTSAEERYLKEKFSSGDAPPKTDSGGSGSSGEND